MSNDSSSQPLTVSTDDRVKLIKIDDGKANALTHSIIEAISAEIDSSAADDNVGAVVIAGRDGKFSGGFDLSVIQSGDISKIMGLVNAGGELCAKIYGSGVPVIAACTGHAVAAGALMLMSCDIRIGADIPAKIGLNETAIGLAVPRWALALADARLNKNRLQQAAATAMLYDSAAAAEIGYLDRVVPADEVLDTALAEATRCASLDKRSYSITVARMRETTLAAMAEDYNDPTTTV